MCMNTRFKLGHQNIDTIFAIKQKTVLENRKRRAVKDLHYELP